MNQEWYEEVKEHARKGGSLESFERCVARVTELHKGADVPLRWVRPRCHKVPDQLEFDTSKLYGSIALHNKQWSINT